MANQYTELLDALGATGMNHADAVALAMDLVAEEAIDPADANRIARKIAGLVMADSAMTDVEDIEDRLKARFGPLVIEMRKAAITGSGLSIGMLKEPGLQLEGETVMGETVMVDAGPTAVTPNGFVGALFDEGHDEGQLGGRNLMTYAYTDVEGPWEEMFKTAYGRLNDPMKPVGPPDPVVAAPGPGNDVTPEQYSAYVLELATYNLAEANYQLDLATIAQVDFIGHPVAGGPSNTPAGPMQVVAVADVDEDGTLVDTVTQFWSLARIETKHLPMPPPRPGGSVIVTPDAMPTEAQYQAEGVMDADDNMLDASMLSGTFDGVPGNFNLYNDTG